MKHTYVKPEVVESKVVAFETAVSGSIGGDNSGGSSTSGCCCGDVSCPCKCWNEGNHPNNGTNHQHDKKCIHRKSLFPDCATVKGDSTTVGGGHKPGRP